MKLLVFSDTHNSPSRMLEIVPKEKDVAACIHLGDGLHDAEVLSAIYPELPVYRVKGNCDPAQGDPSEGLIPFGGVLIFYTHGNMYGVKSGIEELWQAASEKGADIALYGHTHIPKYEERDGIILFNPGSLNLPRTEPGTYGVITVEDGVPNFEIKEYK